MKSKTLSIFAFSIFALALLVSGVSAFTLSPLNGSSGNQVNNPIYLSQFSNSQVISVSGSVNFNLTNSNPFPNSIGPFSLSSVSGYNIVNTNFTLLNLSLSNPSSATNYGVSSATFQINATNNFTSTDYGNTTLNVSYIKSFCSNGGGGFSGDANDTNATMYVSVTNEGTGTQTQWNPLDTIQVQVTLNPQGNTNLNNVELQLGLVSQNSPNNDISNQLTWLNGGDNQYQIGYLSSSGNNVQYTFTFQVNPQVFNLINGGNYYLVVKAYNQNSPSQFCIDYAQGFNDAFSASGGGTTYNGNSYDDLIQIQPQTNYNKMIQLDPNSLPITTQVSCNQQVTLNPTLYNVGPSGNTVSQNQIQVLFSVPDWGISSNQTVAGLSSGGNEQIPFSFTVPQNATQGIHPVYMRVYYGYNTQNGNYQYASDSFKTSLNVQGNCVYATPQTTSIQAQLQSGGKAGQPLVIQATVTNTGSQTVNYNFGLEGYTSWATLSGISPSNITLAPGQSQNILISLNVNKDASGNKQFYLDTYSSGYLITQQPLQMAITPTSIFASITGNSIGTSGNWYIWVIGAINLILVVVIIIVLVRAFRR